MTAQDPELSAALGWPGGISDPVLDRKVLLQMVAALRLASKQALEALEGSAGILQHEHVWPGAEKKSRFVIAALRAALAQQADPTDPGHDVDVLREHVRHLERRVRELHAQQAEPVEPVAWTLTKTLTERKTTTNGFLWFSDPVNSSWTALYTAPPQRTMVSLTEDEIYHATGHFGVSEHTAIKIARAVEQASWEKNNGQA